MPVVNYLLMLTLCVLPSRPRAEPRGPREPRAGVRDGLRGALVGMGAGALIALAMVCASVLAFGSYGTTLFVATPFVMGAVSAFVFNQGVRRSAGATLLAAVGSVLLAGGAILLFALEGAAVPGDGGSARCRPRAAWAPSSEGPWPFACRAARPARLPWCCRCRFFAGIDAAQPAPRVREVVTVVEVDAPPQAVWANVVAFSPAPGASRVGVPAGNRLSAAERRSAAGA